MQDSLPSNTSIWTQSPELDFAAIDIVVTVPTFRRPDHLLKTLDSISAQKGSHSIAIVVMENEAEQRAGAHAAGPRFDNGSYRGLVLIAHDRGNCQAYNAGWITSVRLFPNLKYIAVIDDDEIAGTDWVEKLVATAEEHNAALVGGPQIPVFEGASKKSWRSHPVFRPHYEKSGPVDILYSSGNLLLRADVLKKMPRPYLDLKFNFTGGGDSDFMRRAKAQGFSFAWCQFAPVHETVPASRVTWDWIQKRSLRNGQLSALIEHRQRASQPLGHMRTIARSIVLLLASLPRALAGYLRSGSLLAALYPVHIAIGRLAAEFGYSNEQYRNPAD